MNVPLDTIVKGATKMVHARYMHMFRQGDREPFATSSFSIVFILGFFISMISCFFFFFGGGG